MLERRPFGNTTFSVSVVGIGAGQVGESDVTEAQAAEVLNGALDLGVTLIDTAASYGLSEERIGRHLGRRREEFVLSTKGGPKINSQPDWSPGSVLASIERSLRLTQSEQIDIFYLHSCPIEILRRGDLQDSSEPMSSALDSIGAILGVIIPGGRRLAAAWTAGAEDHTGDRVLKIDFAIPGLPNTSATSWQKSGSLLLKKAGGIACLSQT